MDFRQLQYVLKVAEEGSFSKAAQKLYIAQPSLSQYIQKIEQQLGVQLFDRSSIPLKLTFAGELYIETAKRILDLKDELLQQIDDITNFKKGRLSIGVSPFRSTYIMPKILPYFHKKFPGIEVILVEGTSSELEDYIMKGITDIAFTVLPIEEKQISYEAILREKVLVALPPRHPLGKNQEEKINAEHPYPKINLNALQDEDFILLKSDQKLHQIVIDMCNKAGFSPRVVLESKSIQTAHALVSAGMGVTFVPEILTWTKQTPDQPIYFSIDEILPERTLAIAYRKGRYLSKLALEFINCTKDILGEISD